MQTIDSLINNIEKVIVGKRAVVELAVVSLLCRGHVLLEDVRQWCRVICKILDKALVKSQPVSKRI